VASRVSASPLRRAEPFTSSIVYRDGRTSPDQPLACDETERNERLDYFFPGKDLDTDLVAGIDEQEDGLE
jgi:hypothetical protein